LVAQDVMKGYREGI